MVEGIEPRTSATPPSPVGDGSYLLGLEVEGKEDPWGALRKMERLKGAAPEVPKLSPALCQLLCPSLLDTQKPVHMYNIVIHSGFKQAAL